MIEYSEIFMSLEGEAKYAFHPTVYLRMTRCQFKCAGFNNPNNENDSDGYAIVDFNPSDYNSIYDIPFIDRGCDSQYAVNPAYKHMWSKKSVSEVAEEIVSLIPHNKWTHPITGLPVIFSITGGEPILKWKQIVELLKEPTMQECRHILLETNAAVPLSDKFVCELSEWLNGDQNRKLTWSNSPKLSNSGESRNAAIKPEILVSQQQMVDRFPDQCDMYLKFVGNPDIGYSEIKSTVTEYKDAGVAENVSVWVMPEACSQEQQEGIAQRLAIDCMQNGWLLAYRHQNNLWGNGVGT